ncbi:MAG: hypothetical protein SGJ19_20140 [Planctomycetia bacterium]|nr:hypothetical protein [Planctomycetia bacterium]
MSPTWAIGQHCSKVCDSQFTALSTLGLGDGASQRVGIALAREDLRETVVELSTAQ